MSGKLPPTFRQRRNTLKRSTLLIKFWLALFCDVAPRCAAKGRRTPLSANSPKGSTLTASLTAISSVLTALSYRLGATLAAGAVAIPLEPIPGIDVLYDVGVPIALIWYWYTFFKVARRMTPNPSLPHQRQITHEGR